MIVALLTLGSGAVAQQAAFALPGARLEIGHKSAEFVLASDLDDDGWIDLVVPHPTEPWPGFAPSGFEVRRGGPQGFTAAALVSPDSQGLDAALADGNGDGLVDVIVVGWAGDNGGAGVAETALWLHASEGLGAFAAATGGAVDEPNVYLYGDLSAVGDFNLDGRSDVVLRRSTWGFPSLVFLATGTGGFVPQQSGLFKDEYAAGGIEAFDADGDGDPDIAQATVVYNDLGIASYPVRVALGDGHASFTELPVQTYPSVDYTSELLAADLDGDGLDELITYGQYTDVGDQTGSPLQAGRVIVLRNVGNGSFIEQASTTAAGQYGVWSVDTDLAASDIDGDGFIDVLTLRGHGDFVGSGDGLLSVLRGSPDPFTFTTLPTLVLPASPSCLAVADIDGDGRADLAFGQAGNSGMTEADWGDVRIALGHGDGTFALPERLDLPSPLAKPNGVVLADLDGDDDLDVIATCGGPTGGIAVALADPSVGFSLLQAIDLVPKCQAAAGADLDDDGDADLVMDCGMGPNGGLLTALSAGDGSHFSPPAVVSNSDVDSLALADLDLDGDMDLYTVVTSSSAVDVRLGLGDGTFETVDSNPTQPLPADAVAADVDADGLPDLAVAISDSPSLDLLDGVGGGAFAPATSIQAAARASRLAVGDIDGNGWIDIALAHQVEGLSLLKGFGGGVLEPDYVPTVNVLLADIAILDVDRDSRPDVAGIQLAQDAVRVWRTAANGSLGASCLFDAGEDPAAMAVGDIDGDGQPDMAVAAKTDNAVWHLKDIAIGVWSLGSPLAGSFGTPHLLVEGEPKPDSLMSFTATGLPADSFGFLVLGLQVAGLPFHAGTLVPSPDAAVPMVGGQPLAGRWPEFATGSPIYAQGWFPIAGQFAATNAVVAFTH